MKRTSLLFVCLFAGTAASNASLVFADNFSYPDGTTLSGQTPPVGSGKWDGTDAWKVNGGAVSLVDGGGAVLGRFISPLAAGQKLTLTYDTKEISGFLGDSWAPVSLYEGPDNERCYMGDLGGPGTYWAIGGPILNNTITTNDNSQANTAIFSYVYNTGAWTFSTNAGSYSGTGTPGYALDRLRIASGGTGEGGNMKLDDITVSIASDTITSVPEPGSLLALGGLLGSGMCLRSRRRK